ncbi:MAG: rhomboid family intramembrane serine protease [Leptospiraceae bacterium]|nr:rhomboid family intramembrane serine protease [Leptospiraceae bacterium]MCP5494183.1 rhomboid family intramembrane serine protease [Leptospiraceae bacterium]
MRPVLISIIFISFLWLIKFTERLFNLNFVFLGVRPGEIKGLLGIFTAPLIHTDFEHLFSNTPPLFVSMSGILYLYKKVSWKVFFSIYFLSGIGVWIFARPSYHIGASTLVYGFVSFIFFSGVFRKDKRSIALALIVTLLYGGMVWGVLPVQPTISWEGHLSGAVTGIFLAFYYRKVDPPIEIVFDDEEDYLDNKNNEEWTDGLEGSEELKWKK